MAQGSQPAQVGSNAGLGVKRDGGELVTDYCHPLAGWCVYEVIDGTSMKRRSHSMPIAGMAEEKRLRWQQHRDAGLVPTFDLGG